MRTLANHFIPNGQYCFGLVNNKCYHTYNDADLAKGIYVIVEFYRKISISKQKGSNFNQV